MSNHDEHGLSEAHASSPSNAPSSKRRRVALACLECRRRKLRCDRNYPACTRCQKGGNASSCTYDAGAVEASLANGLYQGDHANDQAANGHHGLDVTPDANQVSLAGLQAHIDQLENRIMGLEKAARGSPQDFGLRGHAADFNDHRELRNLDTAAQEEHEPMIFRGKSFKTQFYGASHHTSYLSLLPGLRSFMVEMMTQHPGLRGVEHEMKSSKVSNIGDPDTDKDGVGLRLLLPPQDVTDLLVHNYIETFESTYRVLHLPSFFEEYSQCLQSMEQARPAFVALLLVMIAAAYCTKVEKRSLLRGDSTIDREDAASYIRVVESWLALQSHKHVTPITFQIRAIILIAQQVNSIKCKRTYTESGTLVRLAISAGLHRDSEIVNTRHSNPAKKRVTLFDQELRRRVWSTISELDLQVAIDRGLPSTLRDLAIDCGPPLNTDDKDCTVSMDRLPSSKPVSEYTKSSFQHISHRTFDLRQDLASLINGRPQNMSYQDILGYDKRIVQALEDIPRWESHQDREAHISRASLQLQLLHLQILLHRPYVPRASQSKRYDYSAIAHLRAAMQILELHHALFDTGSKILCMMRSDILAAVLSVCYNFSTLGTDHRASSQTTSPRKRPASFVLDQRSSTWTGMVGLIDPFPYLENALSIFESKISCLGVGLQDYYCTSAVIGLLKKQLSLTSPASTHELQAAESVSKIIQKMLSLQENFSAAATLASLPNVVNTSTSDGTIGSSAINGHFIGIDGTASSAPVHDLALFEGLDRDLQGFDITGWDLDAFFSF